MSNANATDAIDGATTSADTIIHNTFQSISTLISKSHTPSSSSSSSDPPISDSIRLKLYGYYKCCTTSITNGNGEGGGGIDNMDAPSNHPRPSFFDPVKRAKYDAWMECYNKCHGDTGGGSGSGSGSGGGVMEAMKNYAEAAASQTQTNVGRTCNDMYQQMLADIENLNNDTTDTDTTDTTNNKLEKHEDHAIVGEKKNDSGKVLVGDPQQQTSAAESQKSTNMYYKQGPSSQSSSTKQPTTTTTTTTSVEHPPSTTVSSLVTFVKPLVPRGQLDITFRDLFYALYQCSYHVIYINCIGQGSYFHRMLLPIMVAILFAKVVGAGLLTDGVGGVAQHMLLAGFIYFPMRVLIRLVSDVLLLNYHPGRYAEYYEGRIEQRWLAIAKEGGEQRQQQNDKTDKEEEMLSRAKEEEEVVVGLSVRSLLDLYLTSKSHPVGSEVIVVPPVNIPGMVDVMEYHGLKLVPVDLLPSEDHCGDNKNNDTDDDYEKKKEKEAIDSNNAEIYQTARWGIDVPAVKSAITQKTVAILVVHPFGSIIANPTTMKELQSIAYACGLEVWEDCAQCYTGSLHNPIPQSGVGNDKSSSSQLVGYTGSKYADISFFSFGPIKTSTALGGGLAIVRQISRQCDSDSSDKTKCTAFDAEEVVKSMRRIQSTMYTPQTNFSYLVRVIKCLVLHLASHSRLLCGLVKVLVERIGWEYDEFVVSLTRGFSIKPSLTHVDQRKELIQQLRRQPCMAMLALLCRRLNESNRIARQVEQRKTRCNAFAKRLLADKRLGDVIYLPRDMDRGYMHGWLFPILLANPQRTSKSLLKMGYDVPCGMTQLRAIKNDAAEDGECRRAKAVFDHILYLPITSPTVSPKDETDLIRALGHAVTLTDESSAPQDVSNSMRHHQRPVERKRPLQRTAIMFSLGLLEWYFCFLGLFHNIPLQLFLRMTILIGPWVGVMTSFILVALLCLSQYMGPIYLKSSSTFAKYCGMIFQSPFQQEGTVAQDDEFSQSKTVLELESTKIPTVSNIAAENETERVADESQMVLLTGATGFIGSLLLRELLMHRHTLSIPGGVAAIVRSKRGKSARERMDRLLSQTMFDFLSKGEKQSLVRVVEGDVTIPNCGLEEGQMKSLCQWRISHVFHCAAAVSFSQPLEDAAVSNITSALQLHLLANRLWRKDAKFVYISTAFVHGGNTGTKSKPLAEKLFPLGKYDPMELYKSMLGSQSYASAAMNELGFPNTYTFSKCICEHLIRANKGVETIIIRPSIVGPAVQEPFEGWAGEKPSTIVAAACLYLKFPYNMWCFGENSVPFVPVDVVCRFVMSKSFGCSQINSADHFDSFMEGDEDEKKEMSPSDVREGNHDPTIATVAWDASSPNHTSFSWISYAFTITHLGAVCGHVNRVIAYAGLLLSTKLFPWMNFKQGTFQRLHSIFVRAPLDFTLDVCDKLPLKPRLIRDLKALSPVTDLPVLFFPFANQSFYFKSDLVAPSDFNGERYMFSCAVAAHRFIQMIEKHRQKRSNKPVLSNLREYNIETTGVRSMHQGTSIVVAGSRHAKPVSDLWWALTQPKGNMTIRLAGWLLSKIFRHTAMEIEIDAASFQVLSRTLSHSPKSSSATIVIAPTHRSFYDFLIVSYICFSLPELGLDTPHIAAASDFASIPFIGWLAKRSHAFFLNRGGAKNNKHMKNELMKITNGKRSFVEVFIEGKRSRTRTYIKPKTGFLRCLAENENQQTIILPMVINYEGIPDETSLLKEANNGSGEKMSLARLMNWLCRVLAGHVNIGRVYVSASKTLNPCGQDMQALAKTIQSFHQSRVVVSNFHTKAASLALGLPEEVIREALLSLGCQIWPGMEKEGISPPNSRDLQWSAMLQFCHLFAPFITTSHTIWATWLSPSLEGVEAKASSCEVVKTVLSRLVEHFEVAENMVDEVIQNLNSKGFYAPEEKHIAQYLPSDAPPMFLMQVVIKSRGANATVSLEDRTALSPKHHMTNAVSRIKPIFSSTVETLSNYSKVNSDAEAFGAWGYQDSYFVLNVKPDGSKCVTMKGDRYSISGKPLIGLASFVEKELNLNIDPDGPTFPACGDIQTMARSSLTSNCIDQIASLFGGCEDRITLSPSDRARHGTGHTQEDMYDLRTGRIRCRLPDAVVWPQSEEEVQALVNLARENDWCLIPFGGGTNVTHSTHCPQETIDPRPMLSVDMKLMNRVLWVNEEDGLIHVEAGITGAELIRQMKNLGFTIGHEPDSYEFSTLGGWIATKASGMKQNKYGNIEDIVREVNVVSAKGLLSHKHKVEKTSIGRSSAGIELKSLMLGSEGCLGIITSAVLKIWPVSDTVLHESVLLPNFDAGIRYVKAISKLRGMKPASVRLLDNEQFRLGQALKPSTSGLRSFINNTLAKVIGTYIYSEKDVVCVTLSFEGSSNEVKTQRKQSVADLMLEYGGIIAGSKVGKAGYDLTFAIAYLRDFALNYNILGESFETFVPWSKVRQVIQSTKERIHTEHRNRSLPGVPFVCSRITQLYDDGACVYFYFCMQISGVAEPSEVFSSIESSARQEILDNGGSLSHHHGLGKLRSPFVDQIYSEAYTGALVAMKEALDPHNTFGARNGVFSLLSNGQHDEDVVVGVESKE